MSSPPRWIRVAQGYIGLAEIPGKATAPTIQRWLRELKAWWSDDAVPWCGTFCAAVLNECEMPIPTSWYRARAWLDWGVRIPAPVPGCIVVYERAGGGHVGFVVAKDGQGRLLTLGGNQGNKVSVAPFDPSRVLGYRWPLGEPYSLAPLPVVENGQVSSGNEA